MSVRLDGTTVHLEGDCPVEDAEPLLALLLADPARAVSVEGAGRLHGAVVQVLLAAGVRVSGSSAHPFQRAHVLTALVAGNEAGSREAGGSDAADRPGNSER